MKSRFYLPNDALLTDFYQITMANALFHQGRADDRAVFHLFFRQAPFTGHYAVAAGIGDAIEYVKKFQFDDDSLSYLARLKSESGTILFGQAFINYLQKLRTSIDIYGVQDGDIVFAHEPMLRVEGSLALCLLLETPLLNIINFQTLIATKAARIKQAAAGKKIVDFGLRRAQAFDGAISATKAAFIGGIDATSNLWAAKHFGIPLSGSQSHSFIMSFPTQKEAFQSYMNVTPEACILLCDTYDTEAGVRDAINSFKALKSAKIGIRLDSGDLLSLSIKARNMLDKAGLRTCVIVASGDLDEYEIERLNALEAPIDIFGVGTRLICAHGDPALGGVFKLGAIYNKGKWRNTCKFSNDPNKTTWPGQQAIMRFSKDNMYIFDQIFDPKEGFTLSPGQQQKHSDEELFTKCLMRQGDTANAMLTPKEAQMRTINNLKHLRPELKELKATHCGYEVIVDQQLRTKKTRLKGALS